MEPNDSKTQFKGFSSDGALSPSDGRYDTKTIDTTDTDTDTDGIDTEYWTKSIPILIVGGNWAGSKQSHHVL